MAQAVSTIPIVWKTKQSVADRLLGEVGRPLFDQLLAKSQTIAAKRRWPLQKIKVDYYQDPEVDWEYMILTLDFDCPRSQSRKAVGKLFENGQGYARGARGSSWRHSRRNGPL